MWHEHHLDHISLHYTQRERAAERADGTHYTRTRRTLNTAHTRRGHKTDTVCVPHHWHTQTRAIRVCGKLSRGLIVFQIIKMPHHYKTRPCTTKTFYSSGSPAEPLHFVRAFCVDAAARTARALSEAACTHSFGWRNMR